MRKFYLFCFSLWPTMAIASDFTGMFSFLTLFFVILPTSVVNLILIWSYFRKQKYTSMKFARLHSFIASIPPIFGLVVIVFDFLGAIKYRGIEHYINGVLLLVFTMMISLLIAWLPIYLHSRTSNVEK